MATDEGAQKAITELHESQLGGRTLTVNEARPKEPRGPGGFGGGGGNRGGGGGFGGNRGGGGGGGGRREPRW
jgi:RNA recognition motif-containing protein